MNAPSAVPWLRTRLSVQMFLQFAIWGSWVPVLGNHLRELGFEKTQVGYVYGTGALALMIAPLIAGQIADRYFATQRFLGVAYLAAGAVFLVLAGTREYGSFWWLSLGAMLCFGPTLGLANALCFHHLADSRKDFPRIRVWGTVGWIAAGWLLSFWMQWRERPIGDCLYLAAAWSGLTGLYALTLPHTPPKQDARQKFAAAEILALLRDPSFAVFSLVAFGLMLFATFYYNFTGTFFEERFGVSKEQIPRIMSIGQGMEILTMLLLPVVLKRFGMKTTLAMGFMAWALRFFLFALSPVKEVAIAAQALHGVCFAFTLAAAMIYVDRISPPDVRASAQSFLAWVAYGLGTFAGSILSGTVAGHYQGAWTSFWLVPAVGCTGILLLFLIGFRARDTQSV